MSATNVRWACPNRETSECPAVLAPKRLRRDDVRRYCLTCSARTGKLVERTAPALDRAREARETRAVARDRERRVREKERAMEPFVVDGVDLRTVLAEAWRLPVAREWRARRGLPDAPPELHVRRTVRGAGRLGVAWPWRHKLQVTVYVGPTWVHDADDGHGSWSGPPHRPKVPLGTLLHEVTHVLVGRDSTRNRTGGWHGYKFKACLARLLEDWHEAHPDEARPTATTGDDVHLRPVVDSACSDREDRTVVEDPYVEEPCDHDPLDDDDDENGHGAREEAC